MQCNAFTTRSPSRQQVVDSDSDDDEIIINTSAVRVSSENSHPNRNASALRAKFNKQRINKAIVKSSTPTTPILKSDTLDEMTLTQCEPDDMLYTQQAEAITTASTINDTDDEAPHDLAPNDEATNDEAVFDESAFLPDNVETAAAPTAPTHPIMSPEKTPPPPNPPTPTNAPSSSTPSLANDYSSSKDLPVYSESEFQLAVSAKVAQALKDFKAEAEKEAANVKEEMERKISEAKEEMEKEMTKQMEEVIDHEEKEFEEKTKELKASIAEKDEELKEVKAEHDVVYEEFSTKLDGYEKEMKTKIVAKDEEVKEVKESLMMKEKVLSAVNSQLADHHNNLMGLNEKNAELEQKNATLESSLSTLEEALKEAEAEYNKLKKTHAEEVELLGKKRVKAVERMQAEMAKEAETQFAEANKHFFKLKSEFTSKSDEVAKHAKTTETLKGSLSSVEKKLALATESHKAEVFKLEEQLSELSAKEAEGVATNNKTIEDLRVTMGGRDKVIKDLEAARDASCLSLGKVMAEKEGLTKENTELQSVCEELMELVEKHDLK